MNEMTYLVTVWFVGNGVGDWTWWAFVYPINTDQYWEELSLVGFVVRKHTRQ